MQFIWWTIFVLFLEGISCRNVTPDPKKPKATDLSKSQKNITNSYAVDNPQCRIPELSPYHDSIKKYLKKEKPIICSNLPPLTTVTFNAKTKNRTLKVNKAAVRKYSVTISTLKCCFSIITREYHEGKYYETDDDRYNKSKELCFKSTVELPANAEYIYVNCSSKNKSVFQTIHFLPIEKKPKASLKATKQKKYSVFLFAIDSMSRQNFYRTLQKTQKYIEKRGWLPLEGYVKVGENTFPNAIPIFTGMNVDQLESRCFPYRTRPLDDCPFIWKKFADKGYLTSYSEDQTWMSTFNHLKYGFMNSPTNYYSRPILRLGEDILRKKYDDFCLGPQSAIETLFRFNTEFLQRFHDRPYFNLFWANSFSHDNINLPMTMDDRIKTFLQDIEPYLNSTVVVFFSDHGFRMGDFRSTYVGWQEDKTPFIYFHLPPSLKKSHPHWVRNLQANKNKLTSPFNLHATLNDLLFEGASEAPAGCPKCGTLFAPVPHNRSCADAAIDESWCPCWTVDSSKPDLQPPAKAPHLKLVTSDKFHDSNNTTKIEWNYSF